MAPGLFGGKSWQNKYPLETRALKQNKKTESGTRLASRLSLVPLTGIEPVRCCHRGILSPLRLPIPPQRQEENMRRRTAVLRKRFLRIIAQKEVESNSFFVQQTGCHRVQQAGDTECSEWGGAECSKQGGAECSKQGGTECSKQGGTECGKQGGTECSERDGSESGALSGEAASRFSFHILPACSAGRGKASCSVKAINADRPDNGRARRRCTSDGCGRTGGWPRRFLRGSGVPGRPRERGAYR